MGTRGPMLRSLHVGYCDWHRQPGYYRDLTRHFDPAAELLDVGCGTAWLAEHFTSYTGIDNSSEAIAAAAAAGRNVISGDIEARLPFADASFDAVVVKDVLEHVEKPVPLVREARRVLRPGGLLFASSPDAQRWVWDDYTHHRPYTRRSFRLLFADNGFAVQRLGYESVAPGASVISNLTRRKRRPLLLALLARLPFHRRNVWLLARRPR